MIKKLFPSVGIEEVMENGKKIQRVMTNAKGNMIRKDGTEILRNMEPLKIKNGDAVGKLKEVEKKLGKTKKQSKIDKLNEEYEYTFEANILDINEKLLSILKSNRVNRLSIGIESFDENNQKLLNRKVSYEEAKSKIDLCKK